MEPATRTRDLPGSRADRFVLKTRLGTGGMGEVFLAEDSLLKRRVAIKVILGNRSRERDFRHRLYKEAERASQLNHENIARIHDLIEDKERLLLIMEYVEGQTLRSRLQKPLTKEEFFSIAEQSLAGLNSAHQHGILHCDLKPENLMITAEGRVKILDFGLARETATQEAKTTTETTSAAVGGTPGYMAPEILLGGAPDVRSDIFSVGVVLYEALTGEHPFRSQEAAATPSLAQQDGRPLPSREVPAELNKVIGRMLAKEPSQRYQSCADVLADLQAVRAGQKPVLDKPSPARKKLRILWGALAAIFVVLLVLMFWKTSARMPWSAVPVAASSRQLVVLPFQAASQDANSRAFADGLTETLAAKLGQIADRYPLEIVPASEVRTQRVTNAQEARTALGATLVLQGSLQQSGSTIRVIYSLIETRSRRQVTSGVITADASNAFAVQDRVIEEVLNSLDIELAKQDRRLVAAHGTAQPEAYQHYLRGRGFLQTYDREDNLDAAISEFESSLETDPQFALAYAGLGQAHLHRYSLAHLPESLDAARVACARAVDLDSRSPDGEICLGMLANATGQYEDAVRHLEKALKLDGSRDESYRELAIAYKGLERPADAEALLKRAVLLRPQYWAPYKWLGWFYASHGRYEEAETQFKRVVELAPDSIDGYSNLGAVYVKQGKLAEGIDMLERSIKIQPTSAALNNVGALYFYQRKFPEAARSYEEAAHMSPYDYRIFDNLGEVYGQMEGKQGESRKNYAHALDLAQRRLGANPRDSEVLLDAALYAAILGQSAKAEEYRKAAMKLPGQDPERRFNSAVVLAHLQQDNRALAELDRALQEGLPASEITENPVWKRFGSDPRFLVILEKGKKKK
jgi:eukaryotic-like serine/threonine-protein kinase